MEHALDSILERGEIPDVELFTENICQTIADSDHARTLHLMNTMSASSVEMNEQQWSDLLQQNSHRFRVDALKDLITHLSTSDAIKTDPGLGFVRALQSQCATMLAKDAEEPQADNCSHSNLMEQDELSCKDSLGSHEFSDSSTDSPVSGVKDGLGGDIVLRGPHSEDEHRNLAHWGTQVSAIDKVLDSMNSFGTCSSYEKMPTASEILESWEQECVEDIFAPKKGSRETMRDK